MTKKILVVLSIVFFCFTLSGQIRKNNVSDSDQIKKIPAWKSLGPGGGYVCDLAVYEKNPDIIYARTFYGLFFKSTNGGKTWVQKSRINEGHYRCTAVDQKDPNTVYVSGQTRIFKSKDGGKTWKEHKYLSDSSSQDQEEDEIPYLYYCIVIDPINTQNIYTAGSLNFGYTSSCMAVGKSSDGGETWKIAKLNDDSDRGMVWDSTLCQSSPSNIYVAGYYVKGGKQYNVVYGSSNGGGKWKIIGEFDSDITAVAVNPNDPNNVLVGTLGRVYRTSNGGKSWKEDEDYASSTAFAFNPDNPDIVYSGSFGSFYKSSNGGRNWNRISPGNIGYCYYLHVIPGAAAQMAGDLATDDVIYFAGDNGFFKSFDGGLTFDRQSQGMNAATIDSLIVDPSNTLILYAGYHWYGFFTGKNGGKRWSLTDEFYYGEDIRQIWVNPNNPDDILVLIRRTSTNKYLLRSFDRGKNWERIFEEDANCFLVDPNDPDVILAFGRFPQGTNYYMGMYKSTDGGNSWKSKKISKLEGEVFCAALSPDGSTLYAGGNDGQGYDLNAALYQSFNGGQSWKKLPIPPDNYSVNVICIDPNTPAYVYIGLSYGGVLRSSDSGATWLASTQNTDVKALVLDPKDPNVLIAGGYSGIICSTDHGESWVDANAGMDITSITCFAVNPKKNFIYAGTQGGSIYLNKKLLRKLK